MGTGTAAQPKWSRAIALASQLSVLGCQVILPAVIRFTAGRSDRFVRAWATEALNLHLVWIVPWLGLGAVAAATDTDALFWVAVGYFGIVGLYAVVVGVTGAVKAWRGETWLYPVNLRMVRG